MNLKKFFGPKEFEKEALTVAIPMMLQQVITSCVNLVDNVMVGQLGDAALSGVAAANRFYMIANFGMNGLLIATSIFLAQFFGAKDEEHMKQSFRYMILSVFVLVIPIMLIAYFFSDTVIHFFTSDAQTIVNGAIYLKAVLFSFAPLAISLCISNAMRALGETKIPFMISVVAIVLNASCNYVFMFGAFGLPAFGVLGAAYGTIVARIIEMFLYLIALYMTHQVFATKMQDLFHIDWRLVKRITVKALPLVLNEVLWSSGMATLFKLYATRGPVVLAGYSIAGTTSDIFFTLFGGMAVATTVMVSHRLGAGNIDEARRNGYYLIGFSVKLAVVFAVMMFASSFIVPQFYSVSTEAKLLARHFLQIMSVLFWIYMANTELYFILRAGGETKKTLIMDSLYMWGVNIPLVASVAYLTSCNIYTLYIIGQCTDFMKLIIAYRLVRKETWLNNLTEEKILFDE
ncbi:MAG: MATE family efflux transporter [Erysipelotrichaceae bacterium]|nr:MATE family efflux transporter [Erysipelotrichaceae bacterium]